MAKSAHIYRDYRDNHVIWPGREGELARFLSATYKGLKHKEKNAVSSNSEDALTWSCFDTLAQVGAPYRARALDELWTVAFGRSEAPAGVRSGEVRVGKIYGNSRESTEVDASIEGEGVLVFIEAKLYSPMSQAGENKPHDQIAKKLRVGTLAAGHREFYFVLLDIAPVEALRKMRPRVSLAAAKRQAPGFGGKWVTAYWFARYRDHPSTLKDVFDGDEFAHVDVRALAGRMGWLTWADVFKVVLRALVRERSRSV